MFEITSFSFYEISMFICVNFVFPSPKAIDSNRTTEGGFLRSISQCTIWRLMPIAIDTDIDTTHLLACCMKSWLDLSSQIFKHQEKIIWISISHFILSFFSSENNSKRDPRLSFCRSKKLHISESLQSNE